MSHKLPICSDAAEKAIKNDDTKDTEYHPNFLQAVILRTHRVPQLSTCCNFNDDDYDDEEESPQSGLAVGLAPQN